MTLLLSLLATAHAGVAHFDTLTEGDTFGSVTEDGVTVSGFSNLVDPAPGALTVEDASDTLAGLDGFSAPAALGFGGFVPGPGAAFGQFRSLTIEGPAGATDGSVEVFEFGVPGPMPLTLEAWRGGRKVATDEVTLAGTWVVTHHHLAIHGVPFDRLVLTVADGGSEAVAFLVIDDVVVEGDATAVEPPADTAAPVDTGAPTAVEPPPEPPPVERPADTTTGLTSLGAPYEPGCGCDQRGAGTSAWLAGAGALALLRRRRSAG